MGLELVTLFVWIIGAIAALAVLVSKALSGRWAAAGAAAIAILAVVAVHLLSYGPEIWTNLAYLALAATIIGAVAFCLRPRWLTAGVAVMAMLATYSINLAPKLGLFSELNSMFFTQLWLVLSAVFLAKAVSRPRKKGVS
ncbi:MAG: hypothetical protein AAF940_02900 [Pseudomonadota bacterium]